MAADPLDDLRRQIEEASQLPTAQPYTPSSDPLSRLRATLRSDAANDDRPRESTGGVEAAIGREVLALVGSQPLSAAARAEAVRRVVAALENPTKDNVREVLAVLLSGAER
jgi:hypothetical protein